MNKASRDAARSAVQIFIAAPHCKIRSPIVQSEWHIPCRVRQIESDDAPLAMPGLRDSLQVESLASGVVHAAEKDQRDRGSLAVNQRVDILMA